MTDSSRRLLAIFAHPDDESFGTGGVMTAISAEGGRVVLVCATRGEVGEISDAALATPETLGDVREQELHTAAAAMGIHEVRFLGYRDSGMAGTEANDDPRCLHRAPLDEVVQQLVGIIRRERPQVVVTFDPTGGYGHPDHIAISHATVAAVQAAALAPYHRELAAPWRVQRLCYVAISRGRFQHIRDAMRARGIDTTDFDRFEEADIGWPDDLIDIDVDVSAYADAKWDAFRAHRTQFGADSPFLQLPDDLIKGMLSRESFALAHAAERPARQLGDLFEGLKE